MKLDCRTFHAAISLLVLFPLICSAQLLKSKEASGARDCVSCHIRWSSDFEAQSTRQLELDSPDALRPVAGKSALVASQKMCWSCHDGWVVDSRDAFTLDAGKDPHHRSAADTSTALDPEHLLLNKNKQMYCGSCHTPHSHAQPAPWSFGPFMRMDTDNSALCLDCHKDYKRAGDHPVHVEQSPVQPGGELLFSGQVECLSCHQMHRQESRRLSQKGNDQALCASCHVPQRAVEGSRHDLSTAHSPAASTPNWTGKDPGQQSSCVACHRMHGAAKDTPLWSGIGLAGESSEAVEESVCLNCHREGAMAANSVFVNHGHPARGEFPKEWSGAPLVQIDSTLALSGNQMTCTTCHDPHVWSTDLSLLNAEQQADPELRKNGNALSSFLKLSDDSQGRLCLECHRDYAGILESDHNANTKDMRLVPDQALGQCSLCHATHSEDPFARRVQQEGILTAASRLCLSCHESADQVENDNAEGPRTLGEHGHPLWVKQEEPCDLPLHEQQVSCESCHDPHRWSATHQPWTEGIEGNDATAFLRLDNRRGGLCLNCHQEQKTVLDGPHDGAALREEGKGTCSACHSSHQAKHPANALGTWLAESELAEVTEENGWLADSKTRSSESWHDGAHHCLSCHRSGGGSKLIPAAWAHPQSTPDPLDSDAAGPLAAIDCYSCHNPHLSLDEDHRGLLMRQSDEGSCLSCHGDQALWKYRFYHDPERRERP